ncbi:MAG: amino acid adenylation domain-containing protein [Thermoanaerobaculia bacterium]|nr:amino acid adenylation domain-containing protein [Thermoanaerobaculia bacterium]
MSYGQLMRRSSALAARLREDTDSGESAILLFRAGIDFVTTYLACLQAGILATPVFLPRSESQFASLLSISAAAEARTWLTTASVRSRVRRWIESGMAPDTRLIAIDELDLCESDFEGGIQLPKPSDLAMLQFTSGSTGQPKGVMVSHGNLLANSVAIQELLASDEDSVFVSWLPHFHDMGLVSGILQPLFAGCRAYLLDPLSFLKRPHLWLEAISRYGGTHTVAPNFAYDQCVAKAAVDGIAEDMDLSTWRSAVNGAEPVRARTLRRFTETFAARGFRASSFQPAFGMAESTLMTTMKPPGTDPVLRTVDRDALAAGRVDAATGSDAGLELVSSGRTPRETTVAIVDPESSLECPPNTVGEIWVSGPSVALGYRGLPDASIETFGARLEDHPTTFLRTGDLGFLGTDGDLFVTGRAKDVIIVNGANRYPQDLELTIKEADIRFAPGHCAVVSLDDGTRERIVAVQEMPKSFRADTDDRSLFEKANRAVAQEHDLAIDTLVLVRRGSLPVTTSGKIRRRQVVELLRSDALSEIARWNLEREAAPIPAAAASPRERIHVRDWLLRRIGAMVGIPPSDIDTREPLASYGLVSRQAIGLTGELESWLGREVEPTLVYEHPSLEAIVARLCGDEQPRQRLRKSPAGERSIAIVGMSCRFPGAPSIDEYDRLLAEGRCAIGDVVTARWPDLERDHPDVTPEEIEQIRACGLLDEIDRFDPAFFGIAPREAAAMDPQQRLMLEVGWEALEDAGIAADRLRGSSTGVFVGISSADYGLQRLTTGREVDGHFGIGAASSAAAGRFAYTLGLEGPALAVDTACSSSLVAVHLACRSLLAGECGLAIAGGVNVILTPELSIHFARAGMLAGDGRCKTFDEGADGYVRGEGCGAVVLKPLDDAVEDGDRVLAVIRGSAINQDGRSNGLTAPSVKAQESVLREALTGAGLDAGDIDLLEAHGTGTSLGDPIEVRALHRVYGEGRDPEHPLKLGSVKTNIGHLEAAAGIAGLIKATLAIVGRRIPAHLHLNRLNPLIGEIGAPISIPDASSAWPRGRLRRAALSSFGFVGTNAHVVLEQAPDHAGPEESARGAEVSDLGRHLLFLSAKRAPDLRQLADRLGRHLGDHPDQPLADVVFTSNTGRSRFESRAAVQFSGRDGARSVLARYAREGRAPGVLEARSRRPPRLAFLFSGQGGRLAGRAERLYRDHPAFRRSLDRVTELFEPRVRDFLLSSRSDETIPTPTAVAQPALFALQYALAEMWMHWGLEPQAVCGHSLGEYAAACVAGILDLENAARLVAGRARLMDELPPGAMAVIAADAEHVGRILRSAGDDRVWLAAINGPKRTAISGSSEGVDAICTHLDAEGIVSRRLEVDRAFHSPMTEPMTTPFRRLLDGASLSPAKLDFVSTLHRGTTEVDLAPDDPQYWIEQIRRPVDFAGAVGQLVAGGSHSFLEIGPQNSLTSQGRACLNAEQRAKARWHTSLDDRAAPWDRLCDTLAALFVEGSAIRWEAVEEGRECRRVSLPTYPFRRSRHWFETSSDGSRRTGTPSSETIADVPTSSHPLLGAPTPVADHDHPDVTVWTSVLTADRPGFLADHKVEGTVIFPAAGFCELAMTAFRSLAGPIGVELHSAKFDRAMVLTPSERRQVQTRYEATAPQQGGQPAGRITVYSRSESAAPRPTGAQTPWSRHAEFRVRGIEQTPELEDLDAVRSRCGEAIPGSDFYEQWTERGNEWGPAFQGLRRVWCGADEALGLVEIPEGLEVEGYLAHPALVDACGQVLAACVQDRTAGAFVGLDAGSLELHSLVGSGPLFSHAIVSQIESGGRRVCGDLHIRSSDGSLLARVRGLRLEFIASGRRPTASSEALLRLRWQAVEPLEVPRDDPKDHPPVPSSWLLVGHDGVTCEALATALVQRGSEVQIAKIDPSRSIRHALKDMRGEFGVVDLRSIEIAEADGDAIETSEDDASPGAHAARRIDRLLAQTSDLAAAIGERGDARLWIVTRGACVTEPESTASSGHTKGSVDLVGLTGTALWGMGRSLSLEQPRLWGGLVDLEPSDASADVAEALATALEDFQGEDQIAVRGSELMVPRLTRGSEPKAGHRPALRADATYVITGGLGGLGLTFARWLVARGARRLVLMGRSGLPHRRNWRDLDPMTPAGRRARRVLELESLGTSVHLAQVDVADEGAIGSWYREFRDEGWPEIRGVIHAAGAIRHGLVGELNREARREVQGGKVTGALAFDQLFPELDFFVLFSSASATLSSPGLSSYAAANAVLDALAHARSARGTHALSLAWGAWNEVGLAAEARVVSGGGSFEFASGSLEIEQGLELADRLWSESGHVVVLDADWHQWAKRYPSAAGQAILERLVGPIDAENGHAVDTASKWLDSPEDLLRWLTGETARVLGAAEADLDPEAPLTAMGLDSLMALELRHRLESACGVALPTLLLIRGPSLRELARRLPELRRDESRGPRLTSSERDPKASFPLSHGQRAQWLLYEMAPESAAYHVSFSARIRARIQTEPMASALRRLLERHPILGLRIETHDGQPRQRQGGAEAFELEITDAGSWSSERLRSEVEQTYLRPFDLRRGPVLRVHLFERATGDTVILLVVHHIACDGLSLGLLVADLGVLYAEACGGDPAELAPLPIDYADYVDWQTKLLSGDAGQSLLDYWRNRLDGTLPVLEIRSERPRPSIQTYRGRSLPLAIEPEIAAKLQTLAQVEGTTLFAVLLSLYATLLHRVTGLDDLPIGTPAAGRTDRELEQLVGHFVNAVVVRCDAEGDPSFRKFLHRMRRDLLSDLDHQDMPFPLLVEKLQPDRDASRLPLFQVDFVYQGKADSGEALQLLSGGAATRVSWGGHELTPYPLAQQEGQLDLSFEMVEAGDGLIGSAKYNADVLEEATVVRLIDHFARLARHAGAEPDLRLSQLEILEPHQLQRLILDHQGPKVVSEEPDALLHRTFERQVAETPDSIAMATVDGSLTFRELDRRAEALANSLSERGIGAEALVAVAAGHTLDQGIGILGVLKAGAAYLPVATDLPASRVEAMVANSGSPAILTRCELLESLPSSTTRLSIAQLTRGPAAVRSGPMALPENPAYVIYTSGSTGSPKGVSIPHRTIVNHMRWMARRFPLGPGDRVLQKTPVGFDASIWEYWAPWLAGATLVMPPTDALNDPDRLLAVIREERISILQVVPTLLEILVENPRCAESFAGLRRLFVGGEALAADLPARVRRLVGDQLDIVNLYGPTEATVDSTTWVATTSDAALDVPIGLPIDNVRAYVLDDRLSPVPTGVDGELHLAGAGIGRGYVRNAAETAGRFLPDPYATEKGQRLYRTGDLARRRDDGALVFSGRRDRQVKLRGHRIELGEVEAQLRSLAAIGEAAAAIRRDASGSASLIAYATSTEGRSIRYGDIAASLRDRLPGYMIPSAVIELDALPRTPSGKLDRRALPSVTAAERDLDIPVVEPGSPTERSIAAIWNDVLGHDKAGVHDSFFELGGHSLSMLRVHERLRRELGVEVSVVTLFQYPTIHSLADFLDHGAQEDGLADRTASRQRQRGHRPDAALRRRQARRALGQSRDASGSYPAKSETAEDASGIHAQYQEA